MICYSIRQGQLQNWNDCEIDLSYGKEMRTN